MISVAYLFCIFIIIPVTFIGTCIHSVKSGKFSREKKRMGALFYIGVIPMLILAVAAVVLSCMDKTIEAFITCFFISFWGLLTACIAQVRKNK